MDAEKFVADFPDTQKSHSELLAAPGFRRQICKLLHPTPPKSLLPLVRVLLQREADYRATESAEDDNDGEDYFENLYWVGLFLYQIGDLEDVLPMWRAKQTNMDTSIGFDAQFLVGRGVSETIEYLRALDEPMASEAADYLADYQADGDLDNLDEWLDFRIDYFG